MYFIKKTFKKNSILDKCTSNDTSKLEKIKIKLLKAPPQYKSPK
jgi:hypothetical protein